MNARDSQRLPLDQLEHRGSDRALKKLIGR